MTRNPDKTILLLNFGGPETPEEVRPFLEQMFQDPEILPVPFPPLRRGLARFIASRRHLHSEVMVRAIGGRSPLKQHTTEQAALLEKILNDTSVAPRVRVRPAYAWSPPFIEEMVQDAIDRGTSRILALPLYPQYSYTTTRGSLNRVRRAIRKDGRKVTYVEVAAWFSHPLFLQAHAALIRDQVPRFLNPREDDIHLVFSAHAIPEKLVTKKGDPYREHVQRTVHHLLEVLKWDGPSDLAWQSRMAPVKWIGPSLMETLEALGKKKVPQVLVVPISFVSDHPETLYDIDQTLAQVARRAGIKEFRRTPGLNTHPLFIQALADIARSQKEFWLP